MAGAPDVELSASQAGRMLRSTATIRSRSRQLLERARFGESSWFVVRDEALDAAADLVAETTLSRYPDGDIPFHSRWRHFEAGGVDRLGAIDAALPAAGSAERTRALVDVVLVSVLLDAGAGPDWSYREQSSDLVLTRSEGLGVASWVAFCDGLFSSDPTDPLRVDAGGLSRISADTLGAAFQTGPDNPLTGLPGRVDLLRRLGETLSRRPEIFGPDARPGGLFDHLTRGGRSEVSAVDILSGILEYLGPIWPSDNAIDANPLGDCWHHDAVVGPGLTAGWVPFHKLSQWLTYSLLEPFRWSGVRVTGLDELTGLPEYRNGGLLIDSGVLELRDEGWADREWEVGDELVVEWRALTVALIDEIADLVRKRLGADTTTMPLACVLEGGTWAAGRVLANRIRDGLPPLSIRSTGTVF
ncbi:hypothetical protein GTC6_10251 [Gordonia terrae C-6]|uniref:Uracil phosphoribosyltransferase n=1 Tax=Gordonia terrae C-6 TaxID=1316928 RepID=R7Y9R5_9ACTN|nr:DUF1688 family protein [Gordonia terrae]EON32735.1 hypothetical protein GTC6_10251 [Gordonia terrae C-6]